MGPKPELRCAIKVLKLTTYVDVLDRAQILAEEDEKSKQDGQKTSGNHKGKPWNKLDQKRKGSNSGRDKGAATRNRNQLVKNKEKPHSSECRLGSNMYFSFGKLGHFVKDYKENQNRDNNG